MATSALHNVLDTEWAYVLGLLPVDLDKLASETGAIRRKRSIASAEQLLRLALAYAAADWSFRHTAAMSSLMAGKKMSDVAVLQRVRKCPAFLRALISALLARRLDSASRPPVSVCLVDATTVSSPGSLGANWRLHVSYDLREQQLLEVEVTSAAAGESLTRLQVDPDRIYVADRGYGTTPGLLHLLQAGAKLVVRVTPQNVRLRTPQGDRLKIIEWLQGLPEATAGERSVLLEGFEQPLRLIALRKSPAAARRAQRLAEREGRRKGGTVRPQTLTLAAYVLVITNCAEYSPEQILETYGFRWQIELAFKRLKSLLQLDQLRAHDPDLAQAYLLAKVLAALLVEELTMRAPVFSPWGYRLPTTPS
jgi:hypothetical protein